MSSETRRHICRGDQYIDGSLTDFINSSNSHLLHCDGEALILDYFQVGVLHRHASLAVHHISCDARHLTCPMSMSYHASFSSLSDDAEMQPIHLSRG